MPDPIVRLEDIRRTLDWIRVAVRTYPSLRILLDRVPEKDEDFQVPQPNGRRQRRQRAGLDAGGPGLADDDDEALALAAIAGPLPFVTLAGKALPTRAKRAAARDDLKAAFRDRVGPLVEELESGALSLADFRDQFRAAVKDLHTAGAVAAKGGAWADMDFRDWGRVGRRVQDQYSFADRFVDRIAASRDGTGKALSSAQIRANADLYGDAVSATFSAQEVADRGIDPSVLGVQPGDGSTECRARCKCTWKITVHNKAKGDATARWALGAAEHCRTCLARGRSWRSIKIRNGALVEPLPGVAGRSAVAARTLR